MKIGPGYFHVVCGALKGHDEVFQFSVLPLMRGSLKGLRPFGGNLQPTSPAEQEKWVRGMRMAARVGSKDF
jgi:hypothetical protein